jgi:hypothetical protein
VSGLTAILGVIVGLLIGWRMGLVHARAEMMAWVISNREDNENEDPGCPACGWYGGEHTHECPLGQTAT